MWHFCYCYAEWHYPECRFAECKGAIRRAENVTNRHAVRRANGLKDGLTDEQTVGQSYGWMERQTEERRKHYFLSLPLSSLFHFLSIYITVYISLLFLKERKTERQTDRSTVRQRDGETERQTNR
jgi:hypothetical protein